MDKITVAGSGVLGAQIAFQSAFQGCHVTVYDVDETQIGKLDAKWARLSKSYKRDLQVSQDALDTTVSRLSGTSDLATAVRDAELVIEAIPENLAIKRKFYGDLVKFAGPETIFVTNSSMLLSSAMQAMTGRPDRFLALHFANHIWIHNTAEVMGHPTTSPEVFDQVVAFAERIGMVALPIRKEQLGYILNTMLSPFLGAAMNLLMNEVAEGETIDKTWRIATGATIGPLELLDMIGLYTPYEMSSALGEKGIVGQAEAVAWLKENLIDKGWLGLDAGRGFYRYDGDGQKLDEPAGRQDTHPTS